MIVIFIVWGNFVTHTELLIHWSHFQSGPNDWGFGQVCLGSVIWAQYAALTKRRVRQILPMFLILLPLLDFLGTDDKVPDIFSMIAMDAIERSIIDGL